MTAKRRPGPARAADFVTAQRSGRAPDRIALIERIRAGLPYREVAEAAAAVHVNVKDLADFGIIPQRTLSHSKKTGRFTQAQSDRVARFFRVWQTASETFGHPDKARAWMMRPTRPLGGRAPVTLLDTEEGARLVEDLLLRIDHGLAA